MIQNCTIVGVSGASGSGKSTFSRQLADLLPGGFYLSADDYYKDPLPRMISPQDGKEYPDWNHPSAIDAAALGAKLHSLGKTQNYVVVEGAFLFCLPEIPSLLDFKIYIDAAIETRFYRRIARNLKKGQDLEFIAGYYLNCARHREKEFSLTSKAQADLVIDNEVDFAGQDKTAAELIMSLPR